MKKNKSKSLENDSLLAVSQQDKVEACTETYDYLESCQGDGYDHWESRWKFRQRNGPGGMTWDFGHDGDNS